MPRRLRSRRRAAAARRRAWTGPSSSSWSGSLRASAARSAWLATRSTSRSAASRTADDRRVRRLPAAGPPPGARACSWCTPRDGVGLRELAAVDLTVLELTARRVGLVIDNARLYDREHRLAETLQRAMLPEQAEVDGLDVWTYYAPELRERAGGRRLVRRAAGDARTSSAWSSATSSATTWRPPPPWVSCGPSSGRTPSTSRRPGRCSSGSTSWSPACGSRARPGWCCRRCTRTGETWRLQYSRAGHLPALHVRGGLVTQLGDAGGPLIGFGGEPRTTAEVDLRAGRRRPLLHRRAHRAARPRPARRPRGARGRGRRGHRAGRRGDRRGAAVPARGPPGGRRRGGRRARALPDATPPSGRAARVVGGGRCRARRRRSAAPGTPWCAPARRGGSRTPRTPSWSSPSSSPTPCCTATGTCRCSCTTRATGCASRSRTPTRRRR